eukprot:COSAG06_NODE_1306_length_9917_cov_12.542167_3_plen_430_part_00
MLADTLSPAIVPLVCSGSRSAASRMLRALLAGSPLLVGAARRFLWTRHPVAEQYVTRSGAAALAARAMCSSTANHLYDQLLVKEPGTVAATPWHNDTSYWHLSGSMICSIWLAMDVVPKETGVSYVRGSHAWKMRHSITSFSGGGESNYDYGDQSELVSVPDVEAGVASGAETSVCFKSFFLVCFSQQPVLANDQFSHKQNSSKKVPCRFLLLAGEYELLHWDMEPGDVIIFDSYSLQCVIISCARHATPRQPSPSLSMSVHNRTVRTLAADTAAAPPAAPPNRYPPCNAIPPGVWAIRAAVAQAHLSLPAPRLPCPAACVSVCLSACLFAACTQRNAAGPRGTPTVSTGKETRLFAPFYTKNDDFTKTNIGRIGKALKQGRVCVCRRRGYATRWCGDDDILDRCHFILKMIVLPRQARDKHRESTQKE